MILRAPRHCRTFMRVTYTHRLWAQSRRRSPHLAARQQSGAEKPRNAIGWVTGFCGTCQQHFAGELVDGAGGRLCLRLVEDIVPVHVVVEPRLAVQVAVALQVGLVLCGSRPLVRSRASSGPRLCSCLLANTADAQDMDVQLLVRHSSADSDPPPKSLASSVCFCSAVQARSMR